MRVKTWKVLDRGIVPEDAATIPFECRCGREAELPVLGRVIAVSGGHEPGEADQALVFDIGRHAVPTKIQCRKCGRVLINEATNVR